MLLKNFINFNPLEKLDNQLYRKFSMDMLNPFSRYIESNNFDVFKGGSKFRNGDTLFARITPCLENGKTAYVNSLNDNEVAFGSTEFIVARAVKDVSLPLFVYYLLCSKKIRNVAIASMIGSSGRERVQQIALDNIEIPQYSLSTQQHIVDSIGSVDDAIEKNEEIMSSFQKYIKSLYLTYAAKTKETIKLSNLITKSGTLLKNSEWHNERVIDLSTMPQDNICIITDSNGADFSTNIKTLEDNTLLYGSIRPYFKKCGFTVNHSYVAGTIHTFKVIDEKYFTYILATICSNGFHNYTNTNSQGTKMPIINWETFVNYDVQLVSKNELNDFYCKTVDIYNYIKILMNKTMILKLLKQTLLNKYFS